MKTKFREMRRKEPTFEDLISEALKRADIATRIITIDKIENKPFLRHISIRTISKHNIKFTIGKQELLNGFEMFIALLKLKYKQSKKRKIISQQSSLPKRFQQTKAGR